MGLEETFKEMQLHNKDFKCRMSVPFRFGTIQECKKLLFEALKRVDATAKIEWLPEYDNVAAWMSTTEGKGLLLSGDCGRGKTNIIMGALPLLFLDRYRKVLDPIHIQELPEKLNDKNFMRKWAYVVDEIGSEPVFNNYGTKFYPFMNLINDAEMHLKLCLFSTNNNKAELLQKYDNRTIDRLNRLCKVIQFKGDSLRK